MLPQVPLGPALPWAAVPEPEAQLDDSDSEEECEQPLTLEQLGLRLGDRIEVRWVVEPDEGQPFSRWWGGTILGLEQQQQEQQQEQQQAPADPAGASGSRAPAPEPAPGAQAWVPCYRLRYDAYDGFDEEVVPIQLLGEHVLLDVGSRAPMDWRREGDAYEPPAEEAGGQAAADAWDAAAAAAGDDVDLAPDGSRVLTTRQIAAMMSDDDVACDEAALAEALGRADAAATRAVAAGYRDFVDSLKEFLDAKIAAAGGGGAGDAGGVLITAADVGEFSAMMMGGRGAGGGGGRGGGARRQQ